MLLFFFPLSLPSHAAAVIFIHLSIIFLNSSLSVGNCSRTFVSLYVISPLPNPLLLPRLLFLSASFSPSVAAAFLLQLRKGDPVMSHLTTGGGGKGERGGKKKKKKKKAGEAPLNWHFRANLAAAYFELQSNKWTVEGGGGFVMVIRV